MVDIDKTILSGLGFGDHEYNKTTNKRGTCGEVLLIVRSYIRDIYTVWVDSYFFDVLTNYPLIEWREFICIYASNCCYLRKVLFTNR